MNDTLNSRQPLKSPNRRRLLAAGSAAAAGAVFGGWPISALAQGAQPEQAPQPQVPEAVVPAAPQPEQPSGTPFSFDILTADMAQRAKSPAQNVPPLQGFLANLQYDDYRKINYLTDRALWQEKDSLYRLQAFHMGWLFKQPVLTFAVENGVAKPLSFSTDDFEYRQGLSDRIPPHFTLPGVAGFRLHTPLNRPDRFDELVAFVGASYFRALGRGNGYGLSARGLAINTAAASAEEFPRFTAFYIEKPAPGNEIVVVNAALESPSVTGAYRFEIIPGDNTVMEVTARLFFRADVAQLGIGPLTSMFLFSSNSSQRFDDYRPQVHDSDGLMIDRADGERLWRVVNNPPRLAVSVFDQPQSVKSFGLYQRARKFSNYQDAEAHYENRPSLRVEPLGDWGPGAVQLVEIPSALEVNDNIVAFWVPKGSVKAGDSREMRYRLTWGALMPQENGDLAYVYNTRAGHGGVSGVENEPGTRKFVVDFKGGPLAQLPDDAVLDAQVSVSGGEIRTKVIEKIADEDVWRLVIDVKGRPGSVTELVAHVAGYGQRLTETWLCQWVQE